MRDWGLTFLKILIVLVTGFFLGSFHERRAMEVQEQFKLDTSTLTDIEPCQIEAVISGNTLSPRLTYLMGVWHAACVSTVEHLNRQGNQDHEQ